MIDKENFCSFIKNYQQYTSTIDRLDDILECELYDSYSCILVGKMLDNFIDSHFTENGADWIYYFMFENPDDKAAYLDEIRYPLTTIDELWTFLSTDVNLYFKG